MAEGIKPNTTRPQLKIRRVSLDTGRENVVVISRHSSALQPEVFRGFSRVELRCNSRVLLATLLITDEDALVGPDELGLSEPAFRRFAEPVGTLVTVSPATPPESLDARQEQDPGPNAEARRNPGDYQRPHPLPLLRHGDCRVPDRLGEFHDLGRAAGSGRGDGAGRHAIEMAEPDRRRQALHRRHSGQPHLNDRRPDRCGARPDHSQDLLARDHLTGRNGRHHGSADPGRPRHRGDEGGRRGLPRLSGLGRARQSVAGRRHSHFRRTSVQSRYPRADGRLDHVESSRPARPIS